MTDVRIVKVLYSVLRDRSRWYIQTPSFEDNEELNEISEKAKEIAEKGISKITCSKLYNKYGQWRAEGIDCPAKEHFVCFLEWLCWSMARRELRGIEGLYFEESCYLTFVFVK